MENQNLNFRLSKTGVRVYLRPEFHPFLKQTNILHPDFTRKAKELFGNNSGDSIRGLPKICSENSEDAQTWHYFSSLLSMSRLEKAEWLENFLSKSLKHNLDQTTIENLPAAEILFWRGKKMKPFYYPPPSLGCPEGKTEVDLTISLAQAVVFVEAKLGSEISERTTHCEGRNQIIRNIDVGTYYAWERQLDFYFVLVSSSSCNRSIDLLKKYINNPKNIAEKLPHRSDLSSRLERFGYNLGLASWDMLQ
jgi:hypothetical protein